MKFKDLANNADSIKPRKMKIIVTESQLKRVLNRLVEEHGYNETSRQIISKFYPSEKK